MKKYLFLYISIILLTMVLIFNVLNGNNLNIKQDEQRYQGNNTEFYKDKIIPNNISKLVIGYDGDTDTIELYKGIYKVVNLYIPTFNSMQTNEQLQIYYEKNSEKLLQDIGVANLDELKGLFDKVYINKSIFEYNSSEILIETIKTSSKNIEFDLKIVFNKADEIILHVDFPKSKSGLIKFL